MVGWMEFNVPFHHKYGYIGDEGKLVTTVRVMFPQQRNSCTDCKSAQYCTARGHPLPFPKLYPGPCNSVGMRPRTDTQRDRLTDRQTHTYRRA